MSLGKKILNGAYPFYRGLLYLNTGNLIICLPLIKLSAVNMNIGDIYIITSLTEINIQNINTRLNYFDYQLIESDNEFQNQFDLLKKFIQEQFSNEKQIIKFKIEERIYMLNNQNINASVID